MFQAIVRLAAASRGAKPVLALLIAAALHLLAPVGPAAASHSPPGAFELLDRARATRAIIAHDFQYLAGGQDCFQAVFVSYRRSLRLQQTADQWYQVSQIWADLALAASDPPLRCWASRGFTFLDRLWDRSQPIGCYFARADLDGETPVGTTKWVDDNSLAGLAWLDAARTASDQFERELMLGRARATARCLIEGGLWDDTFGGGFWWNSGRGDSLEGKPAQTNALAAQFFLAFYDLTRDPLYRAWAQRTLLWLDRRLYDPAAELYRWSIHYQDPTAGTGEAISDRFFSYDQSIMIEVNLLAERVLDAQSGYLERARTLGRRLQTSFWDHALGGYDLEAGVPQVFPSYSAWTVQGLLALHAVDPDPRWLDYAAQNVEALHQVTWDPAEGGYFHRYYLCRDPSPPGCGDGAAWAIDRTDKHSIDQSWMQRAQALLAASQLRQLAPVQLPRDR